MGPADLCGWPSQREVSFPIFSELERSSLQGVQQTLTGGIKGVILGGSGRCGLRNLQLLLLIHADHVLLILYVIYLHFPTFLHVISQYDRKDMK